MMSRTAGRGPSSPLEAFVILAIVATLAACSAQGQMNVAATPDTPFKLATFEAAGATRVGLVLGTRVLDIADASAYLVERAGVEAVTIPGEMRALIEQYDAVKTRLYQIANAFGSSSTDGLPFAFDVGAVSIEAPIKYPWNLMAAAANYRTHAAEMGAEKPLDVDKEDPHFFAKSPRSCIIDPGEPFYIPEGRNIDWEAELAIVIGKPAFNVPLERAHDYVFGYSIVYDVSDRGGEGRPLNSMFTGPNWFRGKSRDRAAPFGPYIVPKEFLPNHANLRIVTKVNGVVKQDGNSKDLIYDEAHMIRFLTSIMTLYPGDVVMTGTPDGVGAARKPPEFLRPGDVVEIEIEGIGTLRTPMQAAPRTATTSE